MKEITSEIKKRIFGIYECAELFILDNAMSKPKHERCSLYLVAISDITDADAIEVAKISREYFDSAEAAFWGRTFCFQFIKKESYVNSQSGIEIIDYLRSKGYALPYLNWSVDELVSAGIFKLKNKTSCTT